MRPLLLLVLSLAACVAEETPALDAERRVPVPPVMVLSAGPFVPGVVGELVVVGAQPSTAVRLVRGRNGVGEGPCPPALGGVCLGVLPEILSQQVVLSDSVGVTRFLFTPTAGAVDRDFALQAVSLGADGARTSNPLAVHVYGTAPAPTEDRDGDGFGVVDGDCDDDDSSVAPDQADVVGDGADSNCDGSDGVDRDGDLVPNLSSGGTDCDDANDQVFPGATEACNGLDDDCVGGVDDVFADNDGSGVADCREAAVVVTWGLQVHDVPFFECEGVSMRTRELQELETHVVANGLVMSQIDEDEINGVDVDLTEFAVVIVENGGWSDALRFSTVDRLLEAADRPLILMGDDLAFMAQNTADETGRDELFEMARIASFDDNGGPPNRGLGAVSVDPDHEISQGPFGPVGTFDYAGDFDHVTLMTPVEVLFLKETIGTPAVWVFEDGPRRVGVLQPNVYANNNCPVATPAGVASIGALFANTLHWVRQ